MTHFELAEKKHINGLQILIGITSLLVGTLVYLIDRPPDDTYFIFAINTQLSLYNILPNQFGFLGNTLPDFIHVFSFILISAGIICCGKKGYLIICLSWFFIDSAFELGQKFSSLPMKLIPDWFEGIPFLENSSNYFQFGIFSVFDLYAIIIGAVTAYFILLLTMRRTRL